jgi:Uncharacterized conserved protein
VIRENNSEIMPILFIGHGSPMNAIEENEFTEGWKTIAGTFPKPDAILCISAHWETKGTFVTAMERPKTIHDFNGFPSQLYEVQYPAPGDPELANETAKLMTQTKTGLDQEWGLDHGCWSVLKHLYPAADIPVVQLSLDYQKTPQQHYDLAKELAPLREKGVLILGSGNMVHNLGMVAWDRMNEPEFGYDWATQASEIMKKHILSGDHKPLINYKSQGRTINLSIPTPEHFLPLLYILALQRADEKVNIFNDKTVMGSLSMTSVSINIE